MLIRWIVAFLNCSDEVDWDDGPPNTLILQYELGCHSVQKK